VANNLGVEINHRLVKISCRDDACVPFTNHHRDHLSQTDAKEAESFARNLFENRVDPFRPRFSDVALGQRAGVQQESVGHAYSSRISMMPRLNSFLAGSMPSLSAISCSFPAPIGFTPRQRSSS